VKNDLKGARETKHIRYPNLTLHTIL